MLQASKLKVGDKHTERVATNLSRTQIVQYAGTVVAAFLVQSAVYAVVVRWSGGNVLLAKACAIPPSTVVCYLLLKLGVFTGRSGTGR